MSEELKDHCPAHPSSHAACPRCIEAKRAVTKSKSAPSASDLDKHAEEQNIAELTK